MPAAVATAVQINGPLKNKKIVFNDDGEAKTKPIKEKHNKKTPFPKRQHVKPAGSEQKQVKKPQRIKFDDADEVEEVSSNVPAKNKDKLILDNAGKVKKPQRIKFDDEGGQKEAAADATDDSVDEGEVELQKSKKRNKYQAHTDDDERTPILWEQFM